MADYDVIILGGGPGGYIAAERLAHAGRRVLLAEAGSIGGTCLNVGCIPTKSLLNSAKLYVHAKDGGRFGVMAAGVEADWGRMQEWKGEVVATLVGGVSTMLRRLKVDIRPEWAELLGPGRVRVGDEVVTSTHVIVATGSAPALPPIPGLADNPHVVDSTGMLSLQELPRRVTIVGGGVIGLEFASMMSALGVKTDVIELLDEVAPFMDPELAELVRQGLAGVTFHLGCQVKRFEADGTVVCQDAGGGDLLLPSDVILVATGRRPVVTGWGAVEAGLDIQRGCVVVDDTLRTNLPNVWAVGDVTGRSLLAHAAYRMGEVVAAHITDPAAARRSGQRMRWNCIPWAVYSLPEAAGVGLTSAEAAKAGLDTAEATIPLVLSGRFVAENGLRTPGAVKVLAERGSRVLRGIQVVGPYAPEMIWGAGLLLENDMTIDDARQMVFPHPTVSEGIREALWALES